MPWIIGFITFMALEAVAMVYSNVLRDHVNKVSFYVLSVCVFVLFLSSERCTMYSRMYKRMKMDLTKTIHNGADENHVKMQSMYRINLPLYITLSIKIQISM